MKHVVEVNDLRTRYKDTVAVKGVRFNVGEG